MNLALDTVTSSPCRGVLSASLTAVGAGTALPHASEWPQAIAVATAVAALAGVVVLLMRTWRPARTARSSPGDPALAAEPTAPSSWEATLRETATLRARLQAVERELQRSRDDTRRAERRLARAERMANVGQVAAGLAHEVGAPLCVIRGHAENLLERVGSDQEIRRDLTTIAQQIDRITRTVSDVLAFARVPAPRLEPCDVRDLVRRFSEVIRLRCQAQEVEMRLAFPDTLPLVNADRDQVEQVLLNLALNSLDAMPGGGELTFRVTSVSAFDPDGTAREKQHVAISVEDTGTGIPPEDIQHVFEPFFTSKRGHQRPGSGLGLPIAEAIMREHRGWMKVSSTLGQGTRMAAYFPIGETSETGGRP